MSAVRAHKQDEGKGDASIHWWGPHGSTKLLLWLRPYDDGAC